MTADLAQAEQFLRDGNAGAAQRLVQTILSEQPKHAAALECAARIQQFAGRDERAKELFENAIAIDPELLSARLGLAAVLRRLRDLEGSLDQLSYVLYREPSNECAYLELAFVHRVRGDQGGAIAYLEKALAIRPDFPAAMVELGALYLAGQKFEEALALLERAAEIDPLSLPAQNNLAYAYVRLEQYERGNALFSKLCANTPDSILWPRINLGNAFDNLGEYDKSERVYEQILRHEPNNFAARWNLAHHFLGRRQYGQGWAAYEYRVHQDNIWKARLIPFEPWKGEPLDGKSIVVSAEQGLGDQIMFASCFPDLISQAERVTIECDQRLYELFARSFPKARVIGSGHEMKPRWLRDVGMPDFHTPAGSLPRYFRPDESRFPQHTGYVKADQGKTDAWRARLASLGPALKVGLSWRGGTKSTRRRIRSLELTELEPILRVANCQFVNLQYGDCAAELTDCEQRFGISIAHWPEAIDDYDETAALSSALDLTVSVCTAIIHLNGALGRPVWIMVPSVAEWRYGRSGDTMLWYPSARLFRQKSPGDWSAVIRNIAELLIQRTKSDCD